MLLLTVISLLTAWDPSLRLLRQPRKQLSFCFLPPWEGPGKAQALPGSTISVISCILHCASLGLSYKARPLHQTLLPSLQILSSFSQFPYLVWIETETARSGASKYLQTRSNFMLNNLPPGFPGGSVVKNLPTNAGDAGLIPGSGRSPGRGHGNTLQYSCLENPLDREAWWATVHRITKSRT